MFEDTTQKYNTIVIDPAWDIHLSGKVNRRPNRAEELPYKIMSLQEIKEIPIGKMANVGCHVYCWTTNKMLRDTFDVLQAWGVNYHLTMVLAKPNGMCPCFGYKFATEFCLLGFYGKPMQKFTKIGCLNWLNGFNKAGEHSVKPDEFYRIVSEMSPSPRIDIFARRQRLGWDVFGDEVDSQIPLNVEQSGGDGLCPTDEVDIGPAIL